MNNKREDYIAWDTYFFLLAFMASQRSKDPNTRNGACIICPSSLSPIALGYNGFPRGCNDDSFPWRNDSKEKYENKYPYVEHAERNAIFNAARKGISTEHSILYLYSEKQYYPCDDCAKAIIQSGISEVRMLLASGCTNDKWDAHGTKKMFNASGVKSHISKKKFRKKFFEETQSVINSLNDFSFQVLNSTKE